MNYSLHFNKDIREHIESNEFNLIGSYYDVSKLVGIQLLGTPQKIIEKDCIINIEIPPMVSKAVEDLCKEIPSTLEEFIEDIVKWSIHDVVSKIKKGEFDFLVKYKDFSKISEIQIMNFENFKVLDIFNYFIIIQIIIYSCIF